MAPPKKTNPVIPPDPSDSIAAFTNNVIVVTSTVHAADKWYGPGRYVGLPAAEAEPLLAALADTGGPVE